MDEPSQRLDESAFDGASYVDAATFALRLSSLSLGPAETAANVPATLAPPDQRRFRDVMGCLVTGVCVITATWEGQDVAMTANSVTSVSLDPPLVLVCVARTARFHEAIIRADVWGVSVLAAGAVDLSARFARSSRHHGGDDDPPHHRGSVTDVAIMDASAAALECQTEAVHRAGDHSVVIGRVVGTEMAEEAVAPLVFHRGRYRWLRDPETSS